jgi:hypothetical protein
MAYLRRSKMFEQKGMPDSALHYRKLLEEQRSLSRQTELSTEIAEAHGRYEQNQQKHKYYLIFISIFIIALLVIVFFHDLWVRRDKRMKDLETNIDDITAKMNQYSKENAQLNVFLNRQMSESQDKEKKLKLQLNQSRSDYRTSQSTIERMISHFFLLRDETSWPPEILDEFLDIYRKSSSTRRILLEELDRLSLTTHQKAICLLIRESKHDPKMLWFFAGCLNDSSYQSSKSQIKRKLKEAAPSSPVIQSLLKHFPLERKSDSKEKSKLKKYNK